MDDIGRENEGNEREAGAFWVCDLIAVFGCGIIALSCDISYHGLH
jgi:hypothetical protein